MTTFAYEIAPDLRKQLGLIVLQSDETIEDEFRAVMPDDVGLMVSRVPSDTDVTLETLGEMKNHLTAAAMLFPRAMAFDAAGYGCTSGTATIGPGRIAELVRAGTQTRAVTEPVTALIAAAHVLKIKRLAFLSPYVAEVSEHLRNVLSVAGVETPVFGSFDEGEEAKVARIAPGSTIDAATELVAGQDVDAVFLSCTNLRTFGLIERLEARLDMPVLSSNLVLAWHMLKSAGVDIAAPRDLLKRGTT